jgi:hypothetical protein
MHKPKKMTQQDAARIQSHADQSGKNAEFKRKAQSTADKRAVNKGSRRGGSPGRK